MLIPDFQGNRAALDTVLARPPDVLNHNIETVPRLYPRVRPQADYRRSLELLRRAGEIAPGIPTKSGLMLGLGETAGGGAGDAARPARGRLPHPDARPVPPAVSEASAGGGLCAAGGVRELAHGRAGHGVLHVASAPFVRSSYHAKESFHGLTR